MKKPFPALIVLFLLVLPGSAQALETNELIALTAMPLAVAAVSEITDVPATDLLSVVSTLNNAQVPPAQFVEIVRYAPVALVDTSEPRFVTYVTSEYERGVIGNDLALAIADRYPTYGVREVEIVNPPVVTFVEQRQILPPVVVTRFQPAQFDPLALIAMPLAVAAVADITDIPRNDLFQFIASLNQARVPPPQFVEVVRYSPVVLVDRTQSPLFVSFVRTEIDRGVIGSPLAFAIADRIRVANDVDIDVVRPRTRVIVDRDDFIPANVRHPHGGPPGQLKKQLGLQTGAEVVHGTARARTARVTRDRDDDDGRRPRVTRERRRVAPEPRVKQRGRDRDDDDRPRVRRQQRDRDDDKPRVRRDRGGESRGKARVTKPERAKPQARSGGSGKGNSGGKGKGKGKG